MAGRCGSTLLFNIALAFGILGSVRCAVEIKAVAYNLMGMPPNLTGPLEQNFLLTGAERYKVNELRGPESFVYHNGHIYTGLSDGRIVDISDCGVKTIAQLRPRNCVGPCSRPLGIRMGPDGKLIVADSIQGILRVDVNTGAVEILFSVETPVNGRKCKFINDLVVVRDGTILFTDSSAKWTRNEYLYIVLEGESSGRLIALGPKSRKAIVVLDKLSFPNGLEIGPNEEYLLIAETSRARIRRLDLRISRATWLRQTWFAVNLPGLPDNIRSSGRGTFWVAMSTSRNDNMTSSRVDQYAQQPDMRNMIAMMAEMKQIEEMSEKYGTIVEIDVDGNIIRSLQDPTGESVSRISEVLERDGFLYLGSFGNPFVSRVPVSKKFDVDRFIAKLKSTCRARKLNVVEFRRVLRQIVAIAEFRKALLNAKRRREELERSRITTTQEPITVNTTDITPNTTEASNITVSTTIDTFTNITSQPTTTPSDDVVVTLSSTSPDPEAGDADTSETTSTPASASSTSISSATETTSGATSVTVSTTGSAAVSSASTSQATASTPTISTSNTQSTSTGSASTSSATASSTTQTVTQSTPP